MTLKIEQESNFGQLISRPNISKFPNRWHPIHEFPHVICGGAYFLAIVPKTSTKPHNSDPKFLADAFNDGFGGILTVYQKYRRVESIRLEPGLTKSFNGLKITAS